MIFTLDLSNQAQEGMFYKKTNKTSHPTTTFNTCQNHLGLYLVEKLNFSQHINIKISKENKGI